MVEEFAKDGQAARLVSFHRHSLKLSARQHEKGRAQKRNYWGEKSWLADDTGILVSTSLMQNIYTTHSYSTFDAYQKYDPKILIIRNSGGEEGTGC